MRWKVAYTAAVEKITAKKESPHHPTCLRKTAGNVLPPYRGVSQRNLAGFAITILRQSRCSGDRRRRRVPQMLDCHRLIATWHEIRPGQQARQCPCKQIAEQYKQRQQRGDRQRPAMSTPDSKTRVTQREAHHQTPDLQGTQALLNEHNIESMDRQRALQTMK